MYNWMFLSKVMIKEINKDDLYFLLNLNRPIIKILFGSTVGSSRRWGGMGGGSFFLADLADFADFGTVATLEIWAGVLSLVLLLLVVEEEPGWGCGSFDLSFDDCWSVLDVVSGRIFLAFFISFHIYSFTLSVNSAVKDWKTPERPRANIILRSAYYCTWWISFCMAHIIVNIRANIILATTCNKIFYHILLFLICRTFKKFNYSV